MPDASLFAPVLAVTVVYMVVYYATQANIVRVRTRLSREYTARGDKLDRYFGQDRELLAADRIQLNMLEHMPPFLTLLWLNAAFVDVTVTAALGAAYTALRVVYPVLLGTRLGRGIRAAVLIATVPGYLVIGALGVRLLVAAF